MKWKLLLFTIMTILFVTGFDKADQVHVSQKDITIIKAENVLRYDFKLKNSGEKMLKSEYDYPGYTYRGLEIVIRPNKALAAKMEMVEDSKYIKMVPRGYGGPGIIRPDEEGSFHVEYQIKEGANLQDVKKLAFDSTLLLLDGVNVIREIPLQ